MKKNFATTIRKNNEINEHRKIFMAVDFLCAGGLIATSVMMFCTGNICLGVIAAAFGTACFAAGMQILTKSKMCTAA